MDSLGRTRTNGSTVSKRCRKSASSENSGATSSSCKEVMEWPQGSVTSTGDDSVQKESKLCVGRFFYEHGLEISHVDSPSFRRMLSAYSPRMKCPIPTSEELKGWILKDVMKETRERVDVMKKSWADTGCSILLDGWKAADGRELVNVLVDCPGGTVYLCSYDITTCIGDMDAMQLFFVKVLALVGIENVVQIVTYSDSTFMKEAGKQLMEKYRPIFWTVSASYCIELMLEKLGRMDLINETLSKAKIIARFIYNSPTAVKHLEDQTNRNGLVDCSKIRLVRRFLTLENMVREKKTLETMFLSSHPKSELLRSSVEGRRVAELVANESFWSGALVVLKVVIPLVRVLEWIDGSARDHIGCIYETIDQAKETIKEGLKNEKSEYSPFWQVIDDVWDGCLYSPLHSAGYYLNPNIFYTDDVFIDSEVFTGLCCCIVRSSADPRVQDRIVIQTERYRTAEGAMAAGITGDGGSDMCPVKWWLMYGGECPELQRLAVRIFSQTCDGGSRFQLDRSLVETILSEETKTDKKWLTDMVFFRYNTQLERFVPGKTNQIMCDKLNPMDDWIADKA